MPHGERGVKLFFGQISALVSFYHFLCTMLQHLTELLNFHYLCEVFQALFSVDFLGFQ
jgi:hypothetical protein